MELDINEILSQMSVAIQGILKKRWNYAHDTVAEYLDDRKERLELLSSLRIKNQISQKDFQERVKEEKAILSSELHSISTIAKKTAEEAANAALEIFYGVISKVIK
jgi:hypothetical protein